MCFAFTLPLYVRKATEEERMFQCQPSKNLFMHTKTSKQCEDRCADGWTQKQGTHTHTYTQTHARTHTGTHTHTDTRTHAHTQKHAHSHTLFRFKSPCSHLTPANQNKTEHQWWEVSTTRVICVASKEKRKTPCIVASIVEF